jgi:hypothetical protein
MTYVRIRLIAAAAVTAACLAMPGSAPADELPASYKSDAAQAGAQPSTDRTDAAQSAGSRATDRSDAAQSGWDSVPRSAVDAAFPPAEFRGGDSPVDHPGAARSTVVTPTTIEIVRPERTIVRDVDELLPLLLSSTALLLVLAAFAVPFVRGRALPGRSH